MDTFTAFVVKNLTNSGIVHDHYKNYDSAKLGTLVHQLCCAHYLPRDLEDATQVYPDTVWSSRNSPTAASTAVTTRATTSGGYDIVLITTDLAAR